METATTVLPQNTRPNVRLIYFVPRDRRSQPDIDKKMDQLIKNVQQFYADQMEAHGFGGKALNLKKMQMEMLPCITLLDSFQIGIIII